MPRVRAIWKEKRGTRHVWKVDEMVGGAQRHVLDPFSISGFPHGSWRRRKKISQNQSETSGLCQCYVVCSVWRSACHHCRAEMGEVGGVAWRWGPMDKEDEMTSSEYVERRCTSTGDADRH